MAKRDGGLYDIANAAKRFRSEGGMGSSLGNDPNLLSAVGQLLAAATSGSPGTQNQLASLLSGALSQVGQPQSSGRSAPAAQTQRNGPLGKWDAVVIPTMCVGWLKGKQGGMIKEIEGRSGAVVEIDQSTKDLGHCTVNMHGDEESKRKAYGFVVAEMLKVADQPGSNMDCSAIGTKLSLAIEAKFVGWVKGPKGKVVQDITSRSNTRVDVDQANVNQGSAVINIYGTRENVQYAKELVAHEISKVSQEAAATIESAMVDGLQMQPSSSGCGGGGSMYSQGGSYTEYGSGQHSAIQIPSSYVGWLKGRQGQMIRDIESRSGATVEIDQSTKDLGHCTVNIRGPEEQKKKAFGLVVAEVMKVSDQSGVPLDNNQVGTKIEIPIDPKFVGWVKGPRGKVVQDITNRTSTRIDVDQSSGELATAIIKVFGTHEGIQAARDLIAFEISKVAPDVAAEISSNISQVLPQGMGGSMSSGRFEGGLDSGRHTTLTIPSSYVGWIKGKQGQMVRDIEARSGAVVDIDQSTKELGHVAVNFRGGEEEKKRAYGLIVAEVIKVSEQGGDSFDCTSLGTKVEIRIDSKYVGWIKGPRGKVVQDISTRSSTRVDMDQSNDAFAVVKIYGTFEGVENAKELMAFELSKVSPEAAAEITGQVYNTYPAKSAQSSQPPMMSPPAMAAPAAMQAFAAPAMQAMPAPGTDLAGVLGALAGALGGGGAMAQPMQQQQFMMQQDPLSSQQAAAAQLTQSYLQQLATVAPGLLGSNQVRLS